MNNIDLFDRCTAATFAKLYVSFPVPTDIDFMEMSSELFDEEDTELDAFDKFSIYEHTLTWLVSAGYIQASSVTYDGTTDAVLSVKGLEILRIPSSLSSEESFGEQISSAAKSGAIDLAVSGAKAAISKGLVFLLENA
ncbi:MAG: hypothetical protein CMK32_02565 [Porticoccaceae bacterium]|nr:hypothetical protein [Porticoccaceae bacterium]